MGSLTCERCGAPVVLGYTLTKRQREAQRFCGSECAILADSESRIVNDEETTDRLFRENERLAYFAVSHWGWRLGEDARQLALIALWKAAQQFRSDGGARFSTFAVMKMRYAFMAEAKNRRASEAKAPLSLDETIQGDDVTRGDREAVAYDPATVEIMAVRSAVASLPDRLRYVVEQVDFIGRSQVELAPELGITKTRVQQLRIEAHALLRQRLAA